MPAARTSSSRADELDVAVRHLFRHLGDPQSLRSNVLARQLGYPNEDREFLSAVRAFVRSALPPDSRAATIVERCDIERHTHKSVAADLGLSRRQFYRERTRARTIVAQAFLRHRRVHAGDEPLELFADELEALHELVGAGRIAEALADSEALLASGLPRPLLAQVCALRLTAFAEAGNDDAARFEALRTRRFAMTDRAARAELLYACSRRATAHGDYARALPLARRAAELGVTRDGDPDRARRARARYLHALANRLQEDHGPREAIATFESARDAVLSCSTVPQGQLARITSDLAWTRLSVPAMLDEAQQDALAARATAMRHGLTTEWIWAELVLAFVALTKGDERAAFGHARLPAELAAAHAAGHRLGRIHLLLSRLQTSSGTAHAALKSIRTARAAIPERHYLRVIADLREAEALNAAGDVSSALPLARSVIERASSATCSHYTGAAHLATAGALCALGDRSLATEHCEAGLERLRRGAFLHDLSRALTFTARLTGERRYAQEASQLLATG